MLTQLRQIGDRLGHLLLGDSRGIAPVPVALAALELVDRNGNPVIDTWKAGGALWTAPGANPIRAGGGFVWDFALTGPHMLVRRSTDYGGSGTGALPYLSYADGRVPIVPPVGSILTLTLWNDATDFSTWTLVPGDSLLLDADTGAALELSPIPYATALRYTFQVLEDSDGIRQLHTRGGQVQTVGTSAQGIQAGSSAVGDIRWRASPQLQPGWVRCNGQAISRTTYSALFTALVIETVGVTTNGSPIITGTATTGMGAGMEIEGTGIPAGATILTVNSSTQLTLSANCTATQASTFVTAFPFGNGDGSTTFEIPDLRGRVAAGYDPANSQTRLGSLNAGIFGKTGGVTVFGTLNLTGGSGVTGVNAATSDNVQPTMILAAEIYTGVT